MAEHSSNIARMSVTSQASNWPGEREPSHQDVASANELPDPALLSDFKRALLTSGDAAGCEQLLHIDPKSQVYYGLLYSRCSCLTILQEHVSKKYTYPLTLLSQFPRLPDDSRLTNLCQGFLRCCLNHVFFDRFPLPAPNRESTVPPLRLAMACLASISSGGFVEEAQNLFSAGANLWLVMVEVDNGLARSAEMLLAAVLLIPYGLLGAMGSPHKIATLLICASLTIARRMRLSDPWSLGSSLRQKISTYSPLLWSLWLWDIVNALHWNLSLNFSSVEVLSTMPSSTLAFQDIYREILQEPSSSNHPLFSTINSNSREHAVLLLLAIISDAMTIRRSLGSATNIINPIPIATYKYNPFVPFSAHTELERMESHVLRALDQWYGKFKGSMSPDILALYHYSRLYLSCPAIPVLSQLAEYQPSSASLNGTDLSSSSNEANISDQSVTHAWALLDIAALCPKSREALCPVWMPIVVFHASLVVWAKITLGRSSDSNQHGSRRALLAFKVELEKMPWPCCTRMTATLQRLMSN
ncbi:hypothetical protein F5884DRAFT_172944 [Xylogone sp. PMI_703]|nr:hypothetical protein F5884DRAFT_172944 [Xylogone sp. PMI_703]